MSAGSRKPAAADLSGGGGSGGGGGGGGRPGLNLRRTRHARRFSRHPRFFLLSSSVLVLMLLLLARPRGRGEDGAVAPARREPSSVLDLGGAWDGDGRAENGNGMGARGEDALAHSFQGRKKGSTTLISSTDLARTTVVKNWILHLHQMYVHTASAVENTKKGCLRCYVLALDTNPVCGHEGKRSLADRPPQKRNSKRT